MASFRDISASGIVSLAHAAAADDQPIRRGEFQVLVDTVAGDALLIGQNYDYFVGRNLVLANAISILSGSVGQNAAAILDERSIRVTNESAFSHRLDLVESSVGENSALISTLEETFSTVSGSLSTRIDVVSAHSNENTAAITSEITARTNADGALSTRIDTVSAAAAGAIASVATEATARANADGTLSAKWGVTVDLNGRISGISLNDGTNQQSTFTILADNFMVENPAYPDNPFPSKVIGSGGSARFQTNLGGGTPYQFTGSGGTVSRNANVSILGRLAGVGYGTGFALNRLRHAGANTIVTRFAGQCRQATVWYRVIGQFTDWRVLAAYGWLAPTSGSGNFHTIAGFNQQDISVGATDQLELGYNGLDGAANGDTLDDSNNDIWAGELMVEVVNY